MVERVALDGKWLFLSFDRVSDFAVSFYVSQHKAALSMCLGDFLYRHLLRRCAKLMTFLHHDPEVSLSTMIRLSRYT